MRSCDAVRGLLLSGAALLMAGQAAAFSVQIANGAVLHWNTNSVGLQIDADGSSAVSDGSDVAAVRAAMQSWNDVTCSNFQLSVLGTTTLTDTNLISGSVDGVNRLAWVEDSRWTFGSLALAITSRLRTGNVITEADITMNGYTTNWSTSGGYPDVQDVVTHELGHLLGLEHVVGGQYLADPPTMSPVDQGVGEQQTLSYDDQQAACFLYPTTTYSCRSSADCPCALEGNSP